MIDPNRRIDESHEALPERRLRTGRRSLSLPPSSARRRALSRAISASSPRRTSEVFSSMPVRLEARRSRRSSIFSVVLICINMHHLSISVKLFFSSQSRALPWVGRYGSYPGYYTSHKKLIVFHSGEMPKVSCLFSLPSAFMMNSTPLF